MESFDTIDILDLHGSTKKKEVCPDGSKDENVFAIQQGVAISIFTKLKESTGKCRVRHGDIWGTQKDKYASLWKLGPKSRHQKRIKPRTPSYYFIPRDTTLAKEYEQYWKITDIMKVNSVGIVTARDKLTIRWSEDEVWKTVNRFINLTDEKAKEQFKLQQDARDWKVSLAQEDIRSTGPIRDNIIPISYRPFDARFTYYTGQARGYICMPRKNVMQQMLAKENLGLITARSNKSPSPDHFFCSRLITEAKCGESTTQSYLLPLYIYPEEKKNSGGGNGNHGNMMLFEPGAKYATRRTNLDAAFIAEMETKLKMSFIETGSGKGDLKKTFGPEDIFHYIYAIFHSPTYRSRYAEFLKSDFPRLPLTSKKPLFRKLASLGEKLVGLHLMESSELDDFITVYNVTGNNLVEQVRYLDTKKQVYINKKQFFAKIPLEVWEFRIGGYKVCEKWLKDRKERKLSFEDIRHYQKLIAAISKTLRLMRAIDKAIPDWPIE